MGDKNRITIGDSTYEVKAFAPDGYDVFDAFGSQVGSFKVRGRAVTADDYGVEGSHSCLKIGRLWVEANVPMVSFGKKAPDPFVSRKVTYEPVEAEALAQLSAYEAWAQTLPGLRLSFLTHDAEAKRVTWITVWANREQLEAAKARTPPENIKVGPPASDEQINLVQKPFVKP